MSEFVNSTITILNETESVCPVCLKVIKAQVIVKDKGVYLKKECPDHGPATVYLWPDVEHYRWMNDFRMPFKRPKSHVPSEKGCPNDCGLCSSHLRHPTLVEIEVTHICNISCPVCFMAANAVETPVFIDPDMSTIESMYRNILAKTGSQTSIQLTGGEPTTRKNLPEIVRLGRSIGFPAIEVNTNGLVIARDPGYLERLAEAGISGIYLQFDGLNRSVYKKIRGKDLLEVKLKAVENCREAGVQVVLAMTVIEGINQDQMGEVLEYALANRDVIAGIAYQPAFTSGRFDVNVERRLNMGDVIFQLAEQSKGVIEPHDFWPLGCSHPLCSSATYIIRNEGRDMPFTRLITQEEYRDHYDPESPQGSVFADIAARNFPHFEPGLSIVIMNYMDAMTMDLKRLRECSMTVVNQEGCILPFCVYQLTNSAGKRLSEIE
ncbi:MAG: radical SAM protein [Dehalobacterium sp.]